MSNSNASTADRKRRLRSVLRRDGRACWLCGGAMYIGAHLRQHPRAATLDHVIPVSKGGSNALHNLRGAHKSCNEKRGNALDVVISYAR